MVYPYQFSQQNYQWQARLWAERRGSRHAVGTAGWLVLGSIAVMTVTQACLVLILYRSGFSSGGSLTQQYLADCIGYLLLALVPLLYICFSGRPTEEFLPFGRPAAVGLTGSDMAFLCVVCMALTLACNWPTALVQMLEEALGFSGQIPDMPMDHSVLTQILYVLYGTLIPPLVEEILFRGAVLGSLRRWGDWFAIVVSSLLFGLYHGNVGQFVFATLVGLIFGFLRVRTGSILPCIVLHMLNNGLATLAAVLQEDLGQRAAQTFEGGYFVIIFGLAVCALVYRLAMRKKEPQGKLSIPRDHMASSLARRVSGLFTSGGGVAMLIYGVGVSIYVLLQS
ncbi:MAG: CPBP family intramembrane metalloprotease [Oscillospiraceae bacterium]|jgi:membrane protease YdiL (CAAX protease family)|nr:CPBP family intramembrane metalloprotease [Oscillospiraceae bacterium]MDD3261026.1 CPBP family intramembrane metalloprotease [Oscillospiraceae bacterium]